MLLDNPKDDRRRDAPARSGRNTKPVSTRRNVLLPQRGVGLRIVSRGEISK